ncbi:major facilitator superfamily domain-containing protein [Suillus paluster]|uniref:major facilitator superfamily domain-containing protein n=1 Tax=Suillus paluster TaxID=48578 RepID=UPI001B872756|nr:major facilitator superfamily domain-containing protein [Suillus paluster]KAG1744988.1 major facilitator superfamily domain-containing protein [Suillus paluster]
MYLIQVGQEDTSYNVDPSIHFDRSFPTTPSPAGALPNCLTAILCLQLSGAMLPLPPLSPAETLVDYEPKKLSYTRRHVLLVMFCLAQFLDAFNNSALFSAIPALEVSMGMTESQSTWIISAFQLTFASFLLISGRISDVYNPKTAFIGGVSGLGVISLSAGFVDNTIPIIILRALSGIASAMTIPSALTLLVKIFPDPLEQARAIGLFGGCGCVANVLGLLIGAMFVEWASYHWVFWFVAFVAVPVALACVFIIPPQIAETTDNLEHAEAKWKCLDLVGVSILTVALILFIFAVTSGSTDGWASAIVLVPLIISLSMVVGFFYWETLMPVEKAAIPPRTWFYHNFSILFAVAIMPYLWWSTVFTIFTTLWQNVFEWSVISSAVHMFPIGIVAFAMSFTGSLSRIFSPKWIILTGLSLCMVATILLALGGGKPQDYWPYIFPAFSLGSAGVMLTYTHTNIAIFQAAPSSMAGTVGAIFNGALQFGSAIGLAAVSSIETSVEATHGGSHEYGGRAATFWFLVGVTALQIISVSIFYDRSTDHVPQPKHSTIHPAQHSTHFDEKLNDAKVTNTVVNEKADLADLPV